MWVVAGVLIPTAALYVALESLSEERDWVRPDMTAALALSLLFFFYAVARQALLHKEIQMHAETEALNAKIESFRKEQNARYFDLLATVSGSVSTLEGMPPATLQEFANQDGDQQAC